MRRTHYFILLWFLPVFCWAQPACTDKPSTHGMLLFGTEKIYASHLPVFHPPHNYQVFLKLAFSDKEKKVLVADKQKHPECATYTIEPERFVLPQMLDHPRPFKAVLYRGHFERGGTKISDTITVSIAQIIYRQTLSGENRKDAYQLIVFGNGKEQFAVHQIGNKPDFDQVMQVRYKDAEALTKNPFLLIKAGNEDNRFPLGVSGNDVQATEQNEKETLTPMKQLCLEFADLQ